MDEIKGYLGNSRLKSRGQQITWTPEMGAEMIKCSEDPIYFAENYIKIVHVDRGLIPIQLYDYQKDIIRAITNGRRVIVNTSRQAGKTTVAVVIILHYILFNKHKAVGLLANKGSAAREILARLQLSYAGLPLWLQQGVIEWNKGSVLLENGCEVVAAATTSTSVRGKSLALLYIDEAAFVERWDEFFSSVYPTISSGKTTKILLTSTPNGLNHFYYTAVNAKDHTNGYEYLEVPWQEVPGRDEAWKLDTLASMNFNQEQFQQEFCCQFLGSSGTLITGSVLASLKPKIPVFQTIEGLRVYDNPREGNAYALIVDVSRGKGLDYSAFSVIDITSIPYNQVCTFYNNMTTPIDYAEVIAQTAKKYNEAMILVEINDIGEQVSATLKFDYEVETLLYTESAGRMGKRISSGFGKNVDAGVRTTRTVKAIGCNMLKLLVESQKLIINDENTISELSTFSRKGISYEAEEGNHDDLVMGLVLFGWLTDQRYFKEMTDLDTLNALRERTQEEIEEDLLPFGIINDGREEPDTMRL